MSKMTAERAAKVLAELNYWDISDWESSNVYVDGRRNGDVYPSRVFHEADAIAIAEGYLAKTENTNLRNAVLGAEAAIDRLHDECNQRALDTERVEQLLGHVLGYPHYDPSTEIGSDPKLINIGDLTAYQLAEELIKRKHWGGLYTKDVHDALYASQARVAHLNDVLAWERETHQAVEEDLEEDANSWRLLAWGLVIGWLLTNAMIRYFQ
jgi:hypothetical protein